MHSTFTHLSRSLAPPAPLYVVLTQFLLWRNVGKRWAASPLAGLSPCLGELSAPRTAPLPAILSVVQAPDWCYPAAWRSPGPLPGGGSGRSGWRGERRWVIILCFLVNSGQWPAPPLRWESLPRAGSFAPLSSRPQWTESGTGGGVGSARNRRELYCSSIPASFLRLHFTSLLVIWRLLSYCSITKQNTCGGGGGGGGRGWLKSEKEVGGCVPQGHTALLWPSGFVGHWCALAWGKRGVLRAGDNPLPRVAPSGQGASLDTSPITSSSSLLACHRSLGTDAPESALAWSGHRAQLESLWRVCSLVKGQTLFVPALPSGFGRKSVSSSPWTLSEAENRGVRARCVQGMGGQDEPGVGGDPGGPDAARGSLLRLYLPPRRSCIRPSPAW